MTGLSPEHITLGTLSRSCKALLSVTAKIHAVYRFFDESGELLYVGASSKPSRRLGRHGAKDWFPSVARIDLEWFSTRREALKAEARAIRRECPQYNVAHAKLTNRRPLLRDKALIEPLARIRPAGDEWGVDRKTADALMGAVPTTQAAVLAVACSAGNATCREISDALYGPAAPGMADCGSAVRANICIGNKIWRQFGYELSACLPGRRYALREVS